jgi:hypothetical protein
VLLVSVCSGKTDYESTTWLATMYFPPEPGWVSSVDGKEAIQTTKVVCPECATKGDTHGERH